MRLSGRIEGNRPFANITLKPPAGQAQTTVEVLLDTGSDCELVMSRRMALGLGLTRVGVSIANGAFGNAEATTIYVCDVMVGNGQARRVAVHAPENCPSPLLGGGLLSDKTLSFWKTASSWRAYVVPAQECQTAAPSTPLCPLNPASLSELAGATETSPQT